MQHKVEAIWSLPMLPQADVVCPTSLEGLLRDAASGRRPFAGGTDVLVAAAQRGVDLPPLVWTGSIHELTEVEGRNGKLHVGAAATLGRVAASEAVRVGAPALAEAAALVGSVQIRNVATVVGNLCNASPAADTTPPLLVHEANVEVRHLTSASRSIPIEAFFEGPGRTVLVPGEVVVAVSAQPLAPGEGSAYARFTVRKSMDLAFVGVAARVGLDEDGSRIRSARIALGAVSPTAIMAEEAAAALIGATPDEDLLLAVGRAAAATCHPIDDLRASADYRLRLVEVLTGDTVLQAWNRAKGGSS